MNRKNRKQVRQKKINGKLIQFGFDEKKINIQPEEYVLGALSTEVKNPSGDWFSFLPVYEPQAEFFETWGCTDWGGQNQIEIYTKKVFGFEPNYNEIFNYILAGIGPGGANPHTTYESFRNDGLIDQPDIPFPKTYEEFRNPEQITERHKKLGQDWKNKWDFRHEWLVKPTKESVLENLKYSPIGVAVTAWFEQDGLYIDNGQPNTHWCVAFKGTKTPQGIVLTVFDSYDHSIKDIHPEHHISVAKRILLTKKILIKTSWWQRLLSIFFKK